MSMDATLQVRMDGQIKNNVISALSRKYHVSAKPGS